MDLGLKGRRALVTGASMGIGRMVARMLALEGAVVAGAARRVQRIEELSREVESEGGHGVAALPYDLYQEGSGEALAAASMEALGGVDILVNAAGGTRPFGLDASPEQWHEAMLINFVRTRELTHALLPRMLEQGWGRILNFTGTSEPLDLNGAASGKAATHAWAKGLSRQVASRGVTVNSIQPGRIHSEQIGKKYATPEAEKAFADRHIPIGRFGEPEEIANAALFLVSERARYITGIVLPVDGGLRLFAF